MLTYILEQLLLSPHCFYAHAVRILRLYIFNNIITSTNVASTCTYRRSTIFWNSILARTPRDLAWILVMIRANRSSRISSSWPSRPALKKTWFIRTDQTNNNEICGLQKCRNYSVLSPVLTLVCPSLYWLWSISKEPRSFSEAFLLSMNCPSGIALGFKIRYLSCRKNHFVFTSNLAEILHC